LIVSWLLFAAIGVMGVAEVEISVRQIEQEIG
jgi:hypothetical protein